MSAFPKVEKCKGVKIWSRDSMTDEMMDFGWKSFRAYQNGLVIGQVSEGGCVYSSTLYSSFCKKTDSGMCSVIVNDVGISNG